MNKEEIQNEVWEEHSKSISAQDIVNQYNNPQIFQKEFSDYLNQLCTDHSFHNSLEAGCESGITTMLLDNNIEKTFLDLNADIINKVKQACSTLSIVGNFSHEDMMAMPFAEQSFDLLFNAGVIEHFVEEERCKILAEYSRVLTDHGRIVIAVPNHFSLPYRTAYVIKKEIQGGKRWPWPKEYKIYDLREEITRNNLVLEKRFTLAKSTIYDFFGKRNLIKTGLKLLGLIVEYEGYLTVLVIKKGMPANSGDKGNN